MKTFKSAKNPIAPYKKSISQNKKNNHVNINKIISQYKSENMGIKKKKKIKTFQFKTQLNSLLTIESKIYSSFKKKYSKDKDFYNIKVINNIISNETCHIVAEFKDYLIEGDDSEFLQKIYFLKESKDLLPNIIKYYQSCSIIFPNYVILPESKYIYKNIQRKQRVIDNQLENNDENENKNLLDNKEFIVFNEQVIDSILNQTDTSNIKKYFGLNNNENENSGNLTMDKILNMIDKAEKKSLNKNKKIKVQNKKNLIKNFIKNKSKIKGRNNKRNLNEGCLNITSKEFKTNFFLNSIGKYNSDHYKILSTIESEKKNNKTINSSLLKVQEKKNLNKQLINNLLSKKLIFNTYNNSFQPLENKKNNSPFNKALKKNQNVQNFSKKQLLTSSSSNDFKNIKKNKNINSIEDWKIKINKKSSLTERENNQFKNTTEPEIIELEKKTNLRNNLNNKQYSLSNSLNIQQKNSYIKIKDNNQKFNESNSLSKNNRNNYISVTHKNYSLNKNNHLITISNIYNHSKNLFEDNEILDDHFLTERSLLNQNKYSNYRKIKKKIISNTIIPFKHDKIKGIKINGFDELLKKSRNFINDRFDNSNSHTNRTSNSSKLKMFISVERKKK